MKKCFRWFCMLFCLFLLLGFCSCGSSSAPSSGKDRAEKAKIKKKPSEEFYLWKDNCIVGLTEVGNKQKELVIPARCEAMEMGIFMDSAVENISFEDDDAVSLSLAFYDCKSLVSIELPDDLTVIDSTAFEGCSSLRSVRLPSELTVLESYAFSACKALDSVEFMGTKLKIIGKQCFQDCDSLRTINLPDGLTTIEEGAFMECDNLSIVSLPDSVRSIDKMAFGNTAIRNLSFSKETELDFIAQTAFGINAIDMTVTIESGSWCDRNRSKWDIGFKEIKVQ